MKKGLVILSLSLCCLHLFSQSVYSKKWKESTFVTVPHSFDQTHKTDTNVTYVHEEDLATLEIKEFAEGEKAETGQELDQMAVKMANELDYPSLEIVSQELFEKKDSNSNFLGSSLLIKGKGKRTMLTTLYSRKTDKNYVVMVEANPKYFKEHKEMVKRLSEGLLEY